jgi:carbon-monoxide dehydrogenase small subunit
VHPVQEAFMEHFAAQCGYCTPGMLMSAKVLLDRNPSPTRADVIEAISGNLCRCTGYEPIIDAILATANTRARA